MIVECPGCSTIFPVDPKKIPDGGVNARCSRCSEVFFVAEPEPEIVETRVADTASVVDTPALPDTPPTSSAVEGEPAEEELAEGGLAEEEPTEEEFAQEEEPELPEESRAEAFEAPGEPMAFEPFYESEVGQEVESEGDPIHEAESAFGAAPAEKVAEVEAPEAQIEAPAEEVITPTPAFGKRDPSEKAKRLARVLVSDIILYNPDRHQHAMESGRIKEEFEEEIQKSWSEYVEQVGDEVANSTTFFNDALNEILAKGEEIF